MGAIADTTGIDDLARALAKTSAWPDRVREVEWIQTHISHVFLVGDRVYKLRKAVALPFLDFSTRALRNADCLREVALNRRLAPDVYLGVAPIHVEDGEIGIGDVGESLAPDAEHFVVMRRLPSGRDAQSLLERGQLEERHLEAIADRLRVFHATHGLGVPAPWSPDAWFDRMRAPALACIESLKSSKVLSSDRVHDLEEKIVERTTSLRTHFEARRRAGRAIDAHGDLHLDHVWFEMEGSPPLMIDCIEFDEDLRHIDAASEVAFLAMDLRYRGCPQLAESFLHAYASRSDDYDLFRTVDFHASYRALVRAKVADLATRQSTIEAGQQADARKSTESHFELAERLIEERKTGGLILMCGTVGCGKSTVARDLARAGHGIPIASDRVRKALAGLPATTHVSSGTDEGIYRPDNTDRVYTGLFERALPVAASGRTAILDASFSTRARRDAARAWAEARGLPIRLIEVRCPPEVARERLRERERRGDDPSDAGPEFLEISRSRFEAPEEWPSADHEVVWSSTEPPRDAPSSRPSRS